MKTALVLMLLALAGCAMEPSTTAFERADFGAEPVRYQATIHAYFDELLKDPSSIQYREITAPQKYWMRDQRGLVYGGDRILYGWMVSATVNAKNSFGGYVGFRTYQFLFQGETIAKVLEQD